MKILFALLLLVLVIFWLVDDSPPPSSQSPSVSSRSVDQGPGPIPMSPPANPALVSLRENFANSSSKTARFRLMHELDKEWESDFPFESVIGELASSGQPADYLNYLAQALTRAIKKKHGRPVDLVRTYLAHPSVPRKAKVRLAPALVRLEDTPDTLALVSSLASGSHSDTDRSGFLAALVLSHSSSTHLFSALESMSASPDDWPLSLSIALPPLAQGAQDQLKPHLARILTRTTDQRLFSFAAQTLNSLPPTPQRESLLNLVRHRASQFSTL